MSLRTLHAYTIQTRYIASRSDIALCALSYIPSPLFKGIMGMCIWASWQHIVNCGKGFNDVQPPLLCFCYDTWNFFFLTLLLFLRCDASHLYPFWNAMHRISTFWNAMNCISTRFINTFSKKYINTPSFMSTIFFAWLQAFLYKTCNIIIVRRNALRL